MIGHGVVAKAGSGIEHLPHYDVDLCEHPVVSICLWSVMETAGDKVKLFLKAFGTIVILYSKRRATLSVYLIYL